MFTTYIIFSPSINKYYIGHCEDFSVRISQHNTGRNKSTKAGAPWELVYSSRFDTRSRAMALEKKIKNRGAKRFLDDLKKQVG